jgi:hypothetical protein
MKTQTMEDMLEAGATTDEAAAAARLFDILRPGLKVKANGRVNTEWGDKYPLGLYYTIKRIIEEG